MFRETAFTHHNIFSSQTIFLGIIILTLFAFTIPIIYAEELVIPIPQGDHAKELKSVVEWYVPINHDIEVGDTVTWVNEDITGHTVTSGKGIGFLGNPETDKAQPDGYFDSGIILPEKSWSFTFKEKGFFEYTCTIHPWVERSITVLEPGVDVSKNIRISYAFIVTIIIVPIIIVGTISIINLRRRYLRKNLN
ncbi:MAG: plastocyanin/azurin family copper-binding protein [Nitrosopumilus sp.]